jgi:hypothetical protein
LGKTVSLAIPALSLPRLSRSVSNVAVFPLIQEQIFAFEPNVSTTMSCGPRIFHFI